MAGEFLDVREAAVLLKVQPVTIYRWCRAGRLAAVKIGKGWRIPGEIITALLRAGLRERDLIRPGEGEFMSAVPPSSAALVHQLLLHDARGDQAPAAITAAAVRVQERLRGRLAVVIGDTGFATLFARAQLLARGEFPALARRAFPTGVAAAADEAARGEDPAPTAAELTAVLATFIDLLGTFIGEDLVLRLIRDEWPGVAGGACGLVNTEGRA